jgi:hypothetical protein
MDVGALEVPRELSMVRRATASETWICRKLVQEQLYSAAAIILSPRAASGTGEYCEMSDLTGLKTFVTELAGHVAAEAARTSHLKGGQIQE